MDHGGNKDFNFKAFLSQPMDAETDEAVLHWHKLGPVGSDRLTERWKYGFVWAPFFITTSAMHASKWVNFSSACVGGILGNFALSSHKVQLDLHLAIAPWWFSTHSSFTRTTGIQFTSVSRRKTGSFWLFGAPKETNMLVECPMLHLQRVSFPKEVCLQTQLSHEKKTVGWVI